jgi:hypothetical protein
MSLWIVPFLVILALEHLNILKYIMHAEEVGYFEILF